MQRRRGLVAMLTIALAAMLFASAVPVSARPDKGPPGQLDDTVSVSIAGGILATTEECGDSLTMTREGRMLRTGWGSDLPNVRMDFPGIEEIDPGCHGWVGYTGDQFTGFFILDPTKDGVRLWARFDYDWVEGTAAKKRTTDEAHLFEIDGILTGLDLTSTGPQEATGDQLVVRRFDAGTWRDLGKAEGVELTITIGG